MRRFRFVLGVLVLAGCQCVRLEDYRVCDVTVNCDDGGAAGGGGPATGGGGGTAPTAPGAPGRPTAVPGNAQATVNWAAPASNGGSAITGYTVTSSPGDFPATTGGALDTTVPGLTNGTSYSFTVTATNAVGTGPASAASNAVVPVFKDYEWALWTVPPGSPANFLEGTGIVTDPTTQLVWQRAPGGLNTWASAQTYCAGLSLDGLSGWRLPTLVELLSIVDHHKFNPAVDLTVFSSTPAVEFWSGSTSGLDATNAGSVGFDHGFAEFVAKTGRRQVRCVRCAGAPCTVPMAGAGAPPGRYTVGADTVLDTKTTLTWQRNAPVATYTWPDAGTYCAGLSLSGPGWRLPTVKELESLVDVRAAVAPTIDGAFSPSPSAWFWSSSPSVGSSGSVWVVGFALGHTSFGGDTTNLLHLRCVR